MDFQRRSPRRPSRLGVLPGTFNPVTVAHVGLARAALQHVDEVVFVLPRVLPHKQFHGATVAERLTMLEWGLQGEEAFSIAASRGGLFAEIAEECREVYGPETRLSFLCGRDAAERIVGWDYGRPGAISGMLRSFDLLVAARQGEYTPPADLAPHIRTLDVGTNFDQVSANDVRNRISRGEQWQHLVPEAIHAMVRGIYLSASG